MARRASSRPSPYILLGALAAIALAIFAGKALLGKKQPSLATGNPLHMDEFLENGNQLRGNEYSVEGQIDEKLQWTPDRGQLVSLRIQTPDSEQFLPIEIPPEFNKLNIDVKQKYSFRVKFRQGGIPVATAINRL